MTSKNSFLVNSIENHKRRLWVWIISALVQILFYPGIMITYLSRINAWNENGAYNTVELFQMKLKEAAADAAGFNPNAFVPIALLGILIAVQGFSYLFDRKKVDMYQSVPVSHKRRFVIIYVNGIFMYVLPALVGVVIALLIGVTQGAVTGSALAECVLAFIVNLLYFLVVYHVSILAVMLTGHVVVTGFAVVTLLFVLYAAVELSAILKSLFFDRADYYFADNMADKYSIVSDYLFRVNELKRMSNLSEMAAFCLPLCAKWFAGALVMFALSYFCYLKRPAEAAGSAISFRHVKPFVKVIISTIVALAAYWIVQDATYENLPASLLGMAGAALICCAVMESIFEFDIRASIKHLMSTGIAVVIPVLLFCIYYFDIFGYDTYVPDIEKVESVAIDIGEYQYYYKWSAAEGYMEYYSSREYRKENMFLTDVDAVCELARKGLELDFDRAEMSMEVDAATGAVPFYREISVLYRLKSGREVSRRIVIDWNDASNEELLNRLVGTKEYREGYYQIAKDELPYSDIRKNMAILYTNGALPGELSPMDAEALRDAWLKDMEQFNFSLAKNNRICGMITYGIESRYQCYELPVYESFTNTIDFLKERNVYYPLTLRAEDIATIEVTNHHYNDMEKEVYSGAADTATAQAVGWTKDNDSIDVTKYFEDTKEIEQMVEALYPQDFGRYWNGQDMVDINYDVIITFKTDTDLPYGRGYYYYEFITGQVPDFVIEATAAVSE